MAGIDLTGSLIQGVDTTTGKVDAKKTEREVAKGSSLDKDAFLQLLVAEMKYQDPLQPTSNTDYIAQFAQFSQVESIKNMADNMDLTRAQGLVGQTVIIGKENAQGEMDYITGVVDSVTFEDGKPFLHVNGGSYSMDNLEEVVNSEYLQAQELVQQLTDGLAELPSIENLTANDHDALDKLLTLFNGMSTYQQGYVSDSTQSTLEEYAAQMTKILENLQRMLDEAEAEAAQGGSASTSGSGAAASSGGAASGASGSASAADSAGASSGTAGSGNASADAQAAESTGGSSADSQAAADVSGTGASAGTEGTASSAGSASAGAADSAQDTGAVEGDVISSLVNDTDGASDETASAAESTESGTAEIPEDAI